MIHAPVHPGEILRIEVIESLGLEVGQAATLLGVSRPALSRVLNGRADISNEMALRLEKAGAGTAETWANLQTAYSLHRVRTRGVPNVRPLRAKARA